MEINKTVKFSVNSDLAEKFEIALMLNKENPNEAISKLMIKYVSNSFSEVSKSINVQKHVKSNYLNKEDSNYAKANHKIPIWAHKPQQNNHKIIRAFFQLEQELEFVTVKALSERCNNLKDYPDTFTRDFKGNFAQMKTDASNSHGKVFIVNNDVIEIWSEIKEVLMMNKHFFYK